MKNLKNKTVLITGSAKGLGKQIAIEFAENDCNIIICDIDKNLNQHVEDIKKIGVKCVGYHLDVTKLNDIKKVRDKIINDIGKIDILVNNAGIVFGGKFLDTSLEKHQLTYDVNTHGVIKMLHVFLQDLIDQNEAHIVNISSASGFTSLPGGTTYASSKAALTSLSESLRMELIKDGHKHVKMTIVCTGYINTGMFDGVKEPTFIPMLTSEKLAKKIVKSVRKNKLFILEPPFVKLIPLIKVIFPRFIFDFLGNILGGFNSMDLWKGHSKK
tara:strand:+ start:813 stop:1625 length:813 start_codon:yes stop_codon:yes gene_type:complete